MEAMKTMSYTNDLHEALLRKNGTEFWKCWRSKFECNKKFTEVDGCVDPYLETSLNTFLIPTRAITRLMLSLLDVNTLN